LRATEPRSCQFRRQVELGLRGDERSATKARVVLRELLGRINLKPEGEGELWAEYGVQPTAVLKVVGYSGSGGRICHVRGGVFRASKRPREVGAQLGHYRPQARPPFWPWREPLADRPAHCDDKRRPPIPKW
jgi:hypothetical protein